MFDTYGEDYFSVRGFIDGGWTTVSNAEGDLTKEGSLFHLSVADFSNEVLSQLTKLDTVIFPCIVDTTSSSTIWGLPSKDNSLVALASKCKAQGAHTALIIIGSSSARDIDSAAAVLASKFDATVAVHLDRSSYLPET